MSHPAASQRSRNRALLALASAAVAGLALYAPALRRGFVSEDWLILSRLQRSLLDTLRIELTSPWLGLPAMPFYRPLATVLLQLEALATGLRPTAMHLLHLLLHAGNALLVFALLRRCLASATPLAAALAAALWWLYPWHPSAVVFLGSFATLFAATFVLLCLLTAAAPRRHGPLLPALCFAAALLCYEAAVVTPLLLLAYDLLAHPRRPPGRRWLWHLPFWVLLGTYALIRLLVLAAPVSDYSGLLSRLGRDPIGTLASAVAALPSVALARAPASADRGWLLAGATAALVLMALWWLRAGDRRPPRTALLGAAWFFLFLLPFAYPALTPATGRYAYLAVAGLALVAAALLAAALRARPAVRVATLVAASFLILVEAWHLAGILDLYRQASAISDRVRNELAACDARLPIGTAILAADLPAFVHDRRGLPVAKVFQYGLAEAVRSPFGTLGRRPVYPLPFNVRADVQARLSALDETELLRFRPDGTATRPDEAFTSSGQAPAALAVQAEAGRVCFEARPGRHYVFFIVGETLSHRATVDGDGSTSCLDVPGTLLRSMALLGSQPTLWWLEERRGAKLTRLAGPVRQATGLLEAPTFATPH